MRINTKVSSACCRFDEIESFVFGGFSSRFWALRKHINCLKDEQLDCLPFLSWECISIKMGHREVDLVIKDQDQMNRLLKYLIVKTCTLDGRQGSAKKLFHQIYRDAMLDRTEKWIKNNQLRI